MELFEEMGEICKAVDEVRAKVGMRVDVFLVQEDGSQEYAGLGTITKVEDLVIEFDDGSTEVWSHDYPSEITLDDGRKTEGLDCWWHEVKEGC